MLSVDAIVNDVICVWPHVHIAVVCIKIEYKCIL